MSSEAEHSCALATRDVEASRLVLGVNPTRALGDVPDDGGCGPAKLVTKVRVTTRKRALDPLEELERDAVCVESMVKLCVVHAILL